jgi:hypothetical protein
MTAAVHSNLAKPSMPILRLRSLQRSAIWALSPWLPVVLVAEYPKSGGTWFGGMLAAALGYEFPRNNLPPRARNAVLVGHNLWRSHYRKACVVHRDGRDVAVSGYHHFLFENEWNSGAYVAKLRRHLGFADLADVERNLPRFLEWMLVERARSTFGFNWAQFVDSWEGRAHVETRYEQLLSDAPAELRRVVAALQGIEISAERAEAVCAEFSFQRQSGGRTHGEAPARASFVRKGIAGDWKNHFNAEARAIFDHHCGRQLIRLGYEPDSSWVRQPAHA